MGLPRGNRVWTAHKGGQWDFLRCPYFEVLAEGNRGGGKTETLLWSFAKHVNRGYGPAWRGILFRETYPNLEDVVAKTHKWFPLVFPTARWLGSYVWIWPGGERLYFRHAERKADYWKYHGHEYGWVGWEELCNWPDPDLYLSMMSICRSSDPRMPRMYRATCNPYGVGHHWVKARFIDPAPRGQAIRDEGGRVRCAIHIDLRDNPTLLENDPDYVLTLQALEGPKRQAWLLGDWDIDAGNMFDDVWDQSVHVIEPFAIPRSWYIDRSFDWGSSRPYCVQWWAESDGTDIVRPDGTKVHTRPGDLFLFAEDYGWNGKPNEGVRMTASEIAERVRQVEARWPWTVRPGPADPSIYTVENGRCIASDMEVHGVRWVHGLSKSGSRVNGWELIRERLKNTKKPEGSRLYVWATCRQFIRTFPALPRDEKHMDDVNTDAEDHAADCARYRVLASQSKGGTTVIPGAF